MRFQTSAEPSETLTMSSDSNLITWTRTLEDARSVARKPGSISSIDYHKYINEFFHKEPNLYTHQQFEKAAQLFDHLKRHVNSGPGAENKANQIEELQLNDKLKELPPIEFEDEHEKRLTFTLVFQTLKCKYALSCIISQQSVQ